MNKDTGGPAFPTTVYSNESYQGMTLRDYFAAKALQGFLVDISCEPDDLPSLAVSAYMMADAMLKAREQ